MRGVIGILLACTAACTFDGVPPGAVDAASPPIDAAVADALPPDAATLTLIDRGLVVRYFMDEAALGQGPSELNDSAPEPLNLPITYGQAVYVDDGNRGLYWQNELGTGKVELGLPAAKVSERLQDGMTITMEVVVDIDDADDQTAGQVAGLRGLNADFMLTAIGQDDLGFHRPFGPVAATWEGANERDRMVLHIVFDATQIDAERRIELYKDGVLLQKTTSNPPAQDTGLGLSNNDEFMIGNNQAQNRSVSGTIYYVAYYDQPLDGAEIMNNYQRLVASDDR